MSNYDKIYEYAADNYGLITSAKAKELGIPNVELVKLSNRGRLAKIGHGVYRINHYIPTRLDKFAEAVSIVGEDAHVYGESVLAMNELALVNPTTIFVATPKRIRKKLPNHIKAVVLKDIDGIAYHEGIPSQNVVSAIKSCRGRVMADRLADAVDEARKKGLVTELEAKQAMKELRCNE
jgi:predicted transcriptional regulator of viral defense system